MKRIRRRGALLVMFVAACAVLVGPATAQVSGSPTGRIACVDVVRVFNEFQRQKDLQEQLRQAQERLRLEEEQRRQRIEQLQAQLDALNPTDPTYGVRARELLALQIDYKNWTELNQAALTREIGVWTVEIYRDILKAVALVAERDGYDLVFYTDVFDPQTSDPQQVRDMIRDRKLLYARRSVDISQPILDQLNSTYRAQPTSQMIKFP